jgi:hypothetical protein
MWSAVIVSLTCLLLLETFPGRHNATAEPGVATMRWHTSSQATPTSVDQTIDLAACRELQRQLAEHPSEQSLEVACHRKL